MLKTNEVTSEMSGKISRLLLDYAPPELLENIGLNEESRHEFEQRFASCPRRSGALDLTEASADVLYYVLDQCSALKDPSKVSLWTLTKLVEYVKVYEFTKAKDVVKDIYTLRELAASREAMALARAKKTAPYAQEQPKAARMWQTLLNEGKPPHSIAGIISKRLAISVRTIREWKKSGKLDIELPSS